MLGNQIVSLPCVYLVDYDDTAGVDADQAAADVAVFVIPFKCRVLYAGIAVTEVFAGGDSTPVVDFDSRPTCGGDGSRGAADIGHIVGGTAAAGTFLYDKAGVDEVLEPGEEVVVQLTTAAAGSGATGHFRPVLVVAPLAETMANLDNASETA
jgi:hypothetical protein